MTLLVNKRAIANAFGRAAHTYARHDRLQRYSAKKLLALLRLNKFKNVLDAGCGPGIDSRFWRSSGSHVVALDLSLSMLKLAKIQESADAYLVADIEAIPVADAQFDLVWSHLALQWCSNLSQALSELYRVTRPGGLVAFTTLLSNSLSELIQAWLSVDKYTHVNNFLSLEEVKKISKSYWLSNCSKQSITIYFSNAISAMNSLKGIGATYLYSRRSSKLITRSKLKKIELAWPKQKQGYPLTYQIFYGVIKRD